MLKITIPNSFIPERRYVLDILFSEMLGYEFNLLIKDNVSHTSIEFSNKKKIIINDAFFSKINDESLYINEKNIPKNLARHSNVFTVEKDIVFLFGDSSFQLSDDSYYCGGDIFASAFFMLSRWEERAIQKRDEFNRFSVYDSFAYRHGILNRPIVNEYVEYIYNILEKLGYKNKRKLHEFNTVFTHDVDEISNESLWRVVKIVIKTLMFKIPFKHSLKKILDGISVILGRKKDSFDTFDFLMDQSEKVNKKSYFFIMANNSKNDSDYDIDHYKIKKIIQNIIKRSHVVGFHPGFNSYNNKSLWNNELNSLKKVVKQSVEIGRQHYLRFSVPETWQLWEDANMKWDTTMGYPELPGFRCGICSPFSVFNVVSRKKLKLKEYPLTVMEVSLISYQNLTINEMKKSIYALIDTVKKYNGTFVLLWHNSRFEGSERNHYFDLYENITSYLKNKLT